MYEFAAPQVKVGGHPRYTLSHLCRYFNILSPHESDSCTPPRRGIERRVTVVLVAKSDGPDRVHRTFRHNAIIVQGCRGNNQRAFVLKWTCRPKRFSQWIQLHTGTASSTPPPPCRTSAEERFFKNFFSFLGHAHLWFSRDLYVRGIVVTIYFDSPA